MTTPPVSPVTIYLRGCDETTVITVDLTPAEVAGLKRVAAESRAESTSSCMPSMAVGDGEYEAMLGTVTR